MYMSVWEKKISETLNISKNRQVRMAVIKSYERQVLFNSHIFWYKFFLSHGLHAIRYPFISTNMVELTLFRAIFTEFLENKSCHQTA